MAKQAQTSKPRKPRRKAMVFTRSLTGHPSQAALLKVGEIIWQAMQEQEAQRVQAAQEQTDA